MPVTRTYVHMVMVSCAIRTLSRRQRHAARSKSRSGGRATAIRSCRHRCKLRETASDWAILWSPPLCTTSPRDLTRPPLQPQTSLPRATLRCEPHATSSTIIAFSSAASRDFIARTLCADRAAFDVAEPAPPISAIGSCSTCQVITDGDGCDGATPTAPVGMTTGGNEVALRDRCGRRRAAGGGR